MSLNISLFNPFKKVAKSELFRMSSIIETLSLVFNWLFKHVYIKKKGLLFFAFETDSANPLMLQSFYNLASFVQRGGFTCLLTT